LAESQANPVTYTLESSLDSVNRVEQAAEEMARTAGLEDEDVYRVAMAVREAAVNAVLHGNSYDPEKSITATFESTADSLIFKISDQGKGLDPDTLPDPLAPENLLRGSGRGIFLIRSFMDEVHFRQLQPGTELTLIKHLGTARSAI
jgi:serine/threonine-protein kinase RsbW